MSGVVLTWESTGLAGHQRKVFQCQELNLEHACSSNGYKSDHRYSIQLIAKCAERGCLSPATAQVYDANSSCTRGTVQFHPLALAMRTDNTHSPFSLPLSHYCFSPDSPPRWHDGVSNQLSRITLMNDFGQ